MTADSKFPNDFPGVRIRELSSTDDLDALTRVFDDVWHPDPTNRPVSVDMLKALSHAGNYVVGAYVDGELAGGTVAFFGAPVGEVLHSHMTGVSRRGTGRRVGFALKLHQRDWARAQGLSRITWTFDPLVARNAYFNIAKLGAVPVAYHRDFYGAIGDELGGMDESDRMVMSWAIDGPDTVGRNAIDPVGDLRAAGGVAAIDTMDPAHPISGTEEPGPGDTVLVEIPRDIEAMRRVHPVAASRWRQVTRDALSPLLSDGPVRPVSFLRSGCYVFGPATERERNPMNGAS
ncbi:MULTISPECIES: GNAT family N-acetyltransferase [unclassified Gordonia (in: high G+C Gram-positive bacteria)]